MLSEHVKILYLMVITLNIYIIIYKTNNLFKVSLGQNTISLGHVHTIIYYKKYIYNCVILTILDIIVRNSIFHLTYNHSNLNGALIYKRRSK